MTDTEAPAPAGAADTDAHGGAGLVVRAASTGGAALQWAQPSGANTDREDAEDLLSGLPRRSLWRSSVIGPTLVVLAVVAAYAAITLLWPLTAVAPAARAVEVGPLSAPVASPAWPADGAAAVAVAGFEATGLDGTVASAEDTTSIASITKLVTALMVLDRQPLSPGQSGPDYAFSSRDRSDFLRFRARGESSVDVPVGSSLSEYQMLQAVLIASAGNYAQRLADQFWPSDAVFARAATDWLSAHGIQGVTVVDPTGIGAGNTATPAGVIQLSRKALENPVIAEIVATPAVTLPGVGEITSTNKLLADPGVVGVKTGTLGRTNNLSVAKDLAIGEATVRVFGTVLDQPTEAARDDAARALLTQLEAELSTPYVVPAGTVVGAIDTAWGDSVDIRTSADAAAVLWNGASTSSAASLAATEWDAGSPAGTFSLTGPLGTATVETTTAAAIEEPSPWWRLTHPLQLFGLVGWQS